jgi:hypothetical protein
MPRTSSLIGHLKEIKKMSENGIHYSDIARSFAVNQNTILSFLRKHNIKYTTKKGGSK